MKKNNRNTVFQQLKNERDPRQPALKRGSTK